MPLIALRSATGTVMSAGLDAGGHLGRGLPASRQWHDLQVHADVARRLVEVWLDGEQRTELTATLPAGRPPITAIELGGPGVYDMLEDQLEANTRFMTDTIRPSAPRRITTTVARSRTVTIAWTAAQDDVRVTGYRIFRGSMEIGRTTAGHRRFTDRFAPPGARVVYAVRAFDAAGNLSTARSRVIRVPFLSEPRTRRVRARRVVRLESAGDDAHGDAVPPRARQDDAAPGGRRAARRDDAPLPAERAPEPVHHTADPRPAPRHDAPARRPGGVRRPLDPDPLTPSRQWQAVVPLSSTAPVGTARNRHV